MFSELNAIKFKHGCTNQLLTSLLFQGLHDQKERKIRNKMLNIKKQNIEPMVFTFKLNFHIVINYCHENHINYGKLLGPIAPNIHVTVNIVAIYALFFIQRQALITFICQEIMNSLDVIVIFNGWVYSFLCITFSFEHFPSFFSFFRFPLSQKVWDPIFRRDGTLKM